MTQQELEVIFAQRREEHQAKMRELQLQEAQIQKQRNILKAEYKAGNKALDALKTGTPESCLLNHRKRVGYVLRHNLGKLVREFMSKYYDTAQAVTNFNIEEDGTMTIHITIPAKEQDEQA